MHMLEHSFSSTGETNDQRALGATTVQNSRYTMQRHIMNVNMQKLLRGERNDIKCEMCHKVRIFVFEI